MFDLFRLLSVSFFSPAFFSVGRDSPVSMDSSVLNDEHFNITQSAGILSPASSSITSSVTSSDAFISLSTPSL